MKGNINTSDKFKPESDVVTLEYKEIGNVIVLGNGEFPGGLIPGEDTSDGFRQSLSEKDWFEMYWNIIDLIFPPEVIISTYVTEDYPNEDLDLIKMLEFIGTKDIKRTKLKMRQWNEDEKEIAYDIVIGKFPKENIKKWIFYEGKILEMEQHFRKIGIYNEPDGDTPLGALEFEVIDIWDKIENPNIQMLFWDFDVPSFKIRGKEHKHKFLEVIKKLCEQKKLKLKIEKIKS